MITLEAKLAFLRQPASYPEHVCRVETVETHMSWVFLTEQHAYKLKKPVDYGIPDFSSLEARRFCCEEEVRLNRRLAPDVYLAAVPLIVNAGKHLEIDRPGTAVDWLVKMRRLPAQRMLDYMIRSGTARENDMARIAAKLTDFYRSCPPIPIEPASYRRRFEHDIAQCRQSLAEPSFRLPVRQIDNVRAAQQAALRRASSLLDQRVREHRVVEGHGDLRAEHVCLEDSPVIIDCLEFSRELRIADPVDELALLSLECERLRAPNLGDALFAAYGKLSGDTAPPTLVHFYQSVRATRRAQLTIRHLAEEQFRYSAEWTRRATHYLDMARRHADQANA